MERPEIDSAPWGDSRHSSHFRHSLGKGKKIEQSLAKIHRHMDELFHFTPFAFRFDKRMQTVRFMIYTVWYLLNSFEFQFDGLCLCSFVMRPLMKSKAMFDSQSKVCLPFSMRKTVVLHIYRRQSFPRPHSFHFISLRKSTTKLSFFSWKRLHKPRWFFGWDLDSARYPPTQRRPPQKTSGSGPNVDLQHWPGSEAQIKIQSWDVDCKDLWILWFFVQHSELPTFVVVASAGLGLHTPRRSRCLWPLDHHKSLPPGFQIHQVLVLVSMLCRFQFSGPFAGLFRQFGGQSKKLAKKLVLFCSSPWMLKQLVYWKTRQNTHPVFDLLYCKYHLDHKRIFGDNVTQFQSNSPPCSCDSSHVLLPRKPPEENESKRFADQEKFLHVPKMWHGLNLEVRNDKVDPPVMKHVPRLFVVVSWVLKKRGKNLWPSKDHIRSATRSLLQKKGLQPGSAHKKH